MKKLSTIFITLMMILSFGCAGLDLSKIDTKQVADLVQQVLDQLEKNKPPVVIPPVIPPVVPPVIPPVVPPVTGQIVLPAVINSQIGIIDFDQIPDLMRGKGYGPARDTVLWYVMFSTYGSHIWPGNDFKDDPDAVTIARLDTLRDEIQKWYADYINRVGLFLKANPSIKATILINDGNDKGGFYMGNVVLKQLQDMGVTNQIDMGYMFWTTG